MEKTIKDYHALEVQHYWVFPAGYKKDAKAETRNMVFSGDYVGSRKMDGAFYKFVKDADGNMELLGRSKGVGGDYLNKIEWVPQLNEFFEQMPNETCLIGEIYFPNNEGSNKVTSIMGCLKEKAIERQQKGEKLHYYVFDVLEYAGVDYVEKKVETRIEALYAIRDMKEFSYVEFAHYFSGETLWNELQNILACGGEGVVITKKGTCYQPGKRPARQTLKIKKELQESIDCFFTGRTMSPTELYTGKEVQDWIYWKDLRSGEMLPEGKHYLEYYDGMPIEPVTKPYYYGFAGSLEIGVLKDGKVYPIGWLSGLTDEIKANPQKFKNRCIAVGAMMFTEDKALRHGRMLGFRDDLSVEDCTYEKIWG